MSFLQRFQQSADNVANEYAQRQADIDGVNARGLAKFNETQNYLTQTQNAKNSQILMGADLEKLGGGIGVEPVAAKAITMRVKLIMHVEPLVGQQKQELKGMKELKIV